MQIDRIENFNEDYGTVVGARLTSDMRSIDGFSVLHAAVQMVDAELVARCLVVGANPRTKSKDGSPLNLAHHLAHRAKEKTDNLQAKGAPLESIDAQMMRYLEAKSVVEMLEQEAPSRPTWAVGAARADIGLGKAGVTLGRDSAVSILLDATSIARNPIQQSIPTSSTVSSDLPSEVSDVTGSSTPLAGTSPLLSTPVHVEDTATPLPVLEKADWVDGPFPNSKRCRFGANCSFFARGICHYWHVLPAFLIYRYNSLEQDPCRCKPLSKKSIFWKEKDGFWTSAYLVLPRKIIVYARGGKNCMVSDQDVCWYPSKSDALHALEHTIRLVLLKQMGMPKNT
jgi:hypothetical protein